MSSGKSKDSQNNPTSTAEDGGVQEKNADQPNAVENQPDDHTETSSPDDSLKNKLRVAPRRSAPLLSLTPTRSRPKPDTEDTDEVDQPNESSE